MQEERLRELHIEPMVTSNSDPSTALALIAQSNCGVLAYIRTAITKSILHSCGPMNSRRPIVVTTSADVCIPTDPEMRMMAHESGAPELKPQDNRRRSRP